jgi:Lrp/AsnC family transcriptional regulator, leucine-responsive regulatory protein
MDMDAIDTAILRELRENGRASASEIGRKVSLSVPAVTERIRKLESAGIIRQYTVRISREKTGKALTAFILVCVGGTQHAQTFRDAVVRQPCVLECHHVAGAYDYLLKVAAEDTQALEIFITKTLKTFPGVTGTNTIISLLTLKEEINA